MYSLLLTEGIKLVATPESGSTGEPTEQGGPAPGQGELHTGPGKGEPRRPGQEELQRN